MVVEVDFTLHITLTPELDSCPKHAPDGTVDNVGECDKMSNGYFKLLSKNK